MISAVVAQNQNQNQCTTKKLFLYQIHIQNHT